MKSKFLLSFLFFIAGIQLSAQTPLTTDIGQTLSAGQLGVSSTNFTVKNSQITDGGNCVAIGNTSPDSHCMLEVKGTTAKVSLFANTAPWGIRVGSLSSGTQFIGMGVTKTAADNNYIAATGDTSAVNHLIVEWNYSGQFSVKQASHVSDGTTLSPTTYFTVGTGGYVGVGTDTPLEPLDVRGTATFSDALQVVNDITTTSGNVNTSNLFAFSSGAQLASNGILGANGDYTITPAAHSNLIIKGGGGITGTTVGDVELKPGVIGGNRGRVVSDSVIVLDTGSLTPPTCSVSVNRGGILFTASGAGVKDKIQICAKDASDTYAWQVLTF